MANYQIVGMYDCPWFAKADLLADVIEAHFPNLDFKRTMLDRLQWNDFAVKMKNTRNWHVKRSPLVWQVLVNPEGKGLVIGGVDEFCEYAKAYFGIVLDHLSTKDLQKHVMINRMLFTKGPEETYHGDKTIYNITILNGPDKMLQCFLPKFLSPGIVPPDLFLNIKLFNDNLSQGELDGLALEIIDMASPSVYKASGSKSLSEAMYNTNLVLVLEDLTRKLEEDVSSWLSRIEWSVMRYAQPLSLGSGNSNCKIIVAGDGPQCYVAELLRNTLPIKKIKSGNIIALGHHIVTSAKAAISSKATIPPGTISGLHGYGWPGSVGAYVEVRDAVYRAPKRPRQKRAPCEQPLAEIIFDPDWLFHDFSNDFYTIQRERIGKTGTISSMDMCLADALVKTLHIWLTSSNYGSLMNLKTRNESRTSNAKRGPSAQPTPSTQLTPSTINEKDMEKIIVSVISVGIRCSKNSNFPKGSFMVQPAICYFGKWIPVEKINDNIDSKILKEVTKLWELRQELVYRDSNLAGVYTDYDKMLGLIVENDDDDVVIDGEEEMLGEFEEIGEEEDEEEEQGVLAHM